MEDLKFRLSAVELLQSVTRARGGQYTYRELSSKTGLPVTVLSRYTMGHVLPNLKRAKKLWEVLHKLVDLKSELKRKIRFNEAGYFDNTWIIGDFFILKQAANHAIERFSGKLVTKIFTAAVDGIPLATMVANSLGVNLVIAKGSKEIGVPEFLEETYTLGSTGLLSTLYLPKDIIKKKDSVLIVDDMIKSGETQAALINLIHKAKAEVAGVYSLIAIGDEWKKKIILEKEDMVEVIIKLQQKK
jgi:adenine phosphoribosyltransferase